MRHGMRPVTACGFALCVTSMVLAQVCCALAAEPVPAAGVVGVSSAAGKPATGRRLLMEQGCKSTMKHVCKDTVTHLPGGAVETTRTCSDMKVVTCATPTATSVTKKAAAPHRKPTKKAAPHRKPARKAAPHRQPTKATPHHAPTKPPTRPPTAPIHSPLTASPTPEPTPNASPTPTPMAASPTPDPSPTPVPTPSPSPTPMTMPPAPVQCTQDCTCTGGNVCDQLNGEVLCGLNNFEQGCGVQLVVAQAGAVSCSMIADNIDATLQLIAETTNLAETAFAQAGCPFSAQAAQNAQQFCEGILNEVC